MFGLFAAVSEVLFRDEDSRLVTAAISGDMNAFSDLVKKYEKLIYNLAYQKVRNADDAMDVSQDTFLKAYRSLSSFRGDCKFSTWLYKICRNTALDTIRTRQRHPTVSLVSEDDEGEENLLDIPDTDIGGDPQRRLEQREDIAAVRRAIAALSEEHREILVLRDMEGLSYEDIAEMLGLELGTVKSRINRARKCVKEILEKGNFFECPPSNDLD